MEDAGISHSPLTYHEFCLFFLLVGRQTCLVEEDSVVWWKLNWLMKPVHRRPKVFCIGNWCPSLMMIKRNELNWQKHQTNRNWSEYLRQRKIYVKLIRSKKRDHLSQKVLECKGDSKSLYKLVRSIFE